MHVYPVSLPPSPVGLSSLLPMTYTFRIDRFGYRLPWTITARLWVLLRLRRHIGPDKCRHDQLRRSRVYVYCRYAMVRSLVRLLSLWSRVRWEGRKIKRRKNYRLPFLYMIGKTYHISSHS